VLDDDSFGAGSYTMSDSRISGSVRKDGNGPSRECPEDIAFRHCDQKGDLLGAVLQNRHLETGRTARRSAQAVHRTNGTADLHHFYAYYAKG
jgi:hypothetical protein